MTLGQLKALLKQIIGTDDYFLKRVGGDLVGSTGTTGAHASTHQNGGSDEVSVAGLSGVLADAQTPAAHKDTHKTGGTDAFTSSDVLEAQIRRIRDGTDATLYLATIADAQFLKRSGSNIVSESLANAARIETGTYTGDGGTSQVISLSDTSMVPKYVICWDRNTVDASTVYETMTTNTIVDDNASGYALHGDNTVLSTREGRINKIIALATGSFTVDDNGADNHPNKNGTVYNYLVLGTH